MYHKLKRSTYAYPTTAGNASPNRIPIQYLSNLCVGGLIYRARMYTNIMVVHSPDVCTFHFGFVIHKFSCQPLVFLSFLITTLFHFFLPKTTALTCPTNTLKFTYRGVDIIAYAIRHAFFDEMAS